MTGRLIALMLIGLLTGCGSRAELRPHDGMKPVPKAAEAQRAETATELLTPSTQARPDRKADLLTRSEERKDDPFDLPPGPDNGRKTN